jgi:hypothetical protein
VSLAVVACGGGDSAPAAPAASPSAEQPPEYGVVLDAEEQEKLGVSVAPLRAASYEDRVEGPGVVIDAQSVVQLMTDLATAEAAVRASSSALERARGLFNAGTAVSREALEAAQRQAAADNAQLELAKTKAAVAFGSRAPWLDAKRRGRILAALTDGTAIVVKASFPAGLPDGVPDALGLRRVGAMGAGDSWRATDVWLGPSDPNVPGPVLLAYLGRAQGLVYGERLIASVATGEKVQGAVVPESAVVIAGGEAWCYAAREGDLFVRQGVELDRPTAGGYFQTDDGLEPGQAVVVAGAGLLLARETGGGEQED